MADIPKIRFKGFTEPWEQRKLGEVLKERTERAKGDEELLSVTIANGVIRQIDSEKRNTASEDRSNYKIVKKGDVPYNSMRMWQGAVGNSKYNGIVSPAYTILTPTSEANGKFFMELFKKKSTLQIFQRWSQGLTSDTWNLKYPILSSIQFAIPSVEEQEKIAEYFSSLDHLITLHQRKYFIIYNKLITWEQRKLGHLCERVTRKNKNNESDLPLTIASQYGLIDQRDFFNKVVAAKDMSNYYLLKKGEFAYNKSYSKGFDYGSIKRLNAYEQGCLSTLYICFGITSDDVESDYLECFFDTLKWYSDITMICAEGARNHGLLNVDTKAFFDEVTISMPSSKKEQRIISAYLNNLDHLITLHRRAL